MSEQTTVVIAQRKHPFKSKRFWGFIILAVEICEILSGDPFSLNGYFKWVLFASGSGLWLWGELTAVTKLSWKVWQWQGE